MRKPVRKRLTQKKGKRKGPVVSASVNALGELESEGSSSQVPQLPQAPAPATSQSQDEFLSPVSKSNESSRLSSSSSVVSTVGFHDYTMLSPKKSVPATLSQTEAYSNAVVNTNSKESAEISDVQPVSPSCQPSLHQSRQKSPSSKTSELSPNPPILPHHVLNEVKSKVEMFLYPRWMVVLRQTAAHVVLLSEDSNLSIQRNIIFSTCGGVVLKVHSKSVDVSPYLGGVCSAFPLEMASINDFVQRIVSIVNKVRKLEICAGYDDEKFKSGWALCQMGKIDNNPYQECRYVETFRSNDCELLVPWFSWKCKKCRKLYGPLKRKTAAASNEPPQEQKGNKYMTEEERLWKLKEQQKLLRSAKKKIQRLEDRMQHLIEKEGVFVDQNVSEDLMEILSSDKITPAQSVFLQQQIKASQQKNSKGMRWHPTMIRLALSLYISSPSAYEMLRDTGMVKLPSSRTLFDYSHVKPSTEGIDKVVLDDLAAKTSKFKKKTSTLPCSNGR